MSISGIIQNVTGQLWQYDPEELDEGLQKALKSIDEDIRKQESELKRLKNDSKILKSDKEYKRKNIKSRINELKKEKQNLLFESKERSNWEFKAASFDPDNPATADEMRRRHGASEGRKIRQQQAKDRAEAKRAAGETPEVKTANIIKADGKWGELSNLSKHSFTWDGKEYNSVEHAYQTNKSGKFDKVTYQAYVDRPEALKIVGKFKADYDTNIQLMEDLYRQMLNENPDMLKLLQETEGFEITHQLKKSDIWTKEMPKILTKLRDEFKSTGFETVKMYSVADVQANPDKIYIFGDNTEGWGKGGQAIIRDEPNAFGIATKDSPRDFMSDDNFEANKARIDADIAAIKADGRPIVFPEDGIGTGRADLENKAPQTWAYLQEQLEGLKTATNVPEYLQNFSGKQTKDELSPVLKGRESLPITAEQDRMLEIKWATHWSEHADMWGVQVHATSTAETVDGFYEWKHSNPDVPKWWFPRDFMNKYQLEQRAFIGWGVDQEDINNLKEGFEKGIFDIEKDKELLSGINELDGSSMLQDYSDLEVKSGTVYNIIDNPKGLNQYVNRTLHNYANSDITFDFTTGGPSGAGNSAGKGTPDYMKKWNNIKVDNAGRLDMNNIDEVAQTLSDALTSGQTVNIAGHGNYASTRGGLTEAVPQFQIDRTVQTIFDRAKELAGDKPITGKVISGGQSGFDEAGIRVARNLDIPTEVNVTEYTWRTPDKKDITSEENFKLRIEGDGKIPTGPGTPSIDDPAFNAINEVDQKAGGDGKFARYAIYLIDPISELIEDGAIALAAKMGMPKLAAGLRYWMYYEAANLVATVVDAIPEAANQAALAQMDQSMTLGAGLGLVDEKAFNNWKEDLNSATTKNISEVQEDMYQMGNRSPLTRAWMAFEEKSGLRVPTIFDAAKLSWVKNIFSEASK